MVILKSNTMSSKKRNKLNLKIPSSLTTSTDSPPAKKPSIDHSTSVANSSSEQNANELLFKYKTLREKEKFQENLKEEDFEEIQELDFKTIFHVWKVLYKPNNQIMKRKSIRTETKITDIGLNELKALRECISPHNINCHGYLQEHWGLSIYTEYMDGGSFEQILNRAQKIPEPILGLVSYSVLKGLRYLYEEHAILHRGVSPSNIFVNTKGEIKLSEFELCHQNAQFAIRNVIKCYVAPERLRGEELPSIKSDIWSLGITLIELATGRYPFFSSDESDCSIFEMLEKIAFINNPPRLPDNSEFSAPFSDFIEKVLRLDHNQRADLSQLDQDFWICSTVANKGTIDIAGFVQGIVMENNL